MMFSQALLVCQNMEEKWEVSDDLVSNFWSIINSITYLKIDLDKVMLIFKHEFTFISSTRNDVGEYEGLLDTMV